MEKWIRISYKGTTILDVPVNRFYTFDWACPVYEPLHQPASFDKVLFYFRG